MKNLPTDLLRSFVTVAELQGFTAAADLLGRSQPAISLQIKRLEQILGRPLLLRSGHRLDRAGIAWRIVYTIPDLTGIQAAIEEGLGVTVLARSTVPENLRMIRASTRFPALGKVGISLLRPPGDTNEAAGRLADYVRASLN